MIRPATFVTLMLACSSGAYMFVVKHRAETLDQQIDATTSQIRLTERRIRVLQAEWASENDPNRLAQLSRQFLHLAPMAPSQLVTLGRLAEILPPPGAALPHLPLPPPSPKAPSVQIEPDQAAPAAPLTNAPIASAAPVPAPGTVPVTAPVQLASALPLPKMARPVPLHPAHKVAFAADRLMPAPRRAAHPVWHGAAPAHTYVQHTARSMGTQVMAVTAERAPVPVMPAYTGMSERRYTSARVAFGRPGSGAPQSVFGGLGADLAPPKPVYRSSQ